MTPVRIRLGSCLGGLALLVMFAAITAVVEVGCVAGNGLEYISPGEHWFWLAHALLALPGVLLLAWGWAPRLAPAVDRLHQRITGWRPHHWRIAAAAYFLLLLLLAVGGRRWVLLDMPITDDENAVAFGGRILAAGHLSVPTLQPAGAFSELFLYQRHGRVTSMDFPGAVAAAALSEASGLGSWLYALLAAGTGLAVVYAAGLLGGRLAALATSAIWLCSPMVVTLSMTTHSHLVSRAWVAAAVVLYLRTLRSGRGHDALGFGTAFAFGVLVRPFEAGCLLLPLWLHLAARARSRAASPTTPLLAALPLAGGAALFAWYNALTTGVWWLPARFAPGGMAAGGIADPAAWMSHTVFERLAVNLGFNAVLLGVFFLAPIGVVLVYAGLKRGAEVGSVLFAGVLLVLSVALLHGNVGIHSVGPIHYSETAVPLALLAGLGVLGLWEAALSKLTQPAQGIPLLVFYLFLGLGFFTMVHCRSLRIQAQSQRLAFDAAGRAGIHNAIVLAPQPSFLLRVRPDLSKLGSWVYNFPPPDPFFNDDVLWVSPDCAIPELRRRFPDRQIYRLGIRRQGDPLLFAPADG